MRAHAVVIKTPCADGKNGRYLDNMLPCGTVVQLDMPCLKAFEGVSQAGHYADGTSRGEGGVAPPGYARARSQCSPVTSSISSYTLGEIATGIDLLRSRNSGSPITVAIAA